MITPFMIAIGLSMDTLSVSLVGGCTTKRLSVWQSLKIAVFFGLIQATMTFLGALIGIGFKRFITDIDHWLAFILLVFIGGRMIYEAYKKHKKNSINLLNPSILFSLSIATSIDALIVGMSFAFLELTLYKSIFVIGLVTFFFALTGIGLGRRLQTLPIGRYSQLVGGIILGLIGLKILIEHVF